MHSFDPAQYSPALAEVLREPRLAELGPGSPNRALQSTLERLTPAALLAPGTVRDADMAGCCLAGVWLYHDFLDESHRICQDIGTPTGSYWHALMHRREPDAGNSKYWWRRVGKHPVFAQLGDAAARLGWRTWDPEAFVDECENERGTGSPRERLLREVQLVEWEQLFAWCYRQAVGQ